MAMLTQCVAIDVHTIEAVQVVDKIGQEHVHTATTTQSGPPHTRAEGGESQHQQHKSMAMLTQCVAINVNTNTGKYEHLAYGASQPTANARCVGQCWVITVSYLRRHSPCCALLQDFRPRR